jgi:hypothetical protein
MLDAFIIEELKKRDERRRREERRPVLEIPTEEEYSEGDYDADRNDDSKDESQTIVIDFES